MAGRQRAAFAATLRLQGEDGLYTKAEGGDSIELRAVRGATPFRESPTGQGTGRIIRSTDFLFDPDAFHRAVGRWPADGDTFAVAPPVPVGDIESTTFRVTPFNGEPVYRIEATYSQLRVHTQEADET